VFIILLYHLVLSEICQDCLQLSANVTAVIPGDVILFISTLTQRPNNGITLFINRTVSTDARAILDCHLMSNDVSGSEVVYSCTAVRSGTVTVNTNTVFCDSDLYSQNITITIEEQTIVTSKTQNEHGM